MAVPLPYVVPLPSVLVLVAGAVAAQPAARRTVVVDGDKAVVDAVAVALSPWDLAVVPVQYPRPDGDLSRATAWAAAIASDTGAAAVVWTAAAGDARERGSFWLYDAASRQVTVRLQSVPPVVDAPAAAALALSVKTMLRSTNLAPEPPAPAPLVTAPTQQLPELTPERPATPPAATTARALRVDAILAQRTPTGVDGAETVGALGFAWWPASLDGHLGVRAAGRAGTGVGVVTASFVGQQTQTSFEADVCGRVEVGRRLALEAWFGASGVAESFSGKLVQTGRDVRASRLNPGLQLGAAIDVPLGGKVWLGPIADATFLLRFQHYTVDGTAVFDEPRLGVVLGGRLSVGVD